MAQRVRRRQDDDCAARSADPSLRNHRDRKRELALQAPRLSRCTAPACPRWANRHLPRCATSDSWRSLRSARVPPIRYRDKPEPTPERGHDWTPIRGQTSAPIDTLRRKITLKAPGIWAMSAKRILSLASLAILMLCVEAAEGATTTAG